MLALGITFILSTFLLSNAVQPPYLTTFDKETLKTVFSSVFDKGINDVQSVSLAVNGFALLEEKLEHEKDACSIFKKAFLNSEKLNELFAAASGASFLKLEKCALDSSKSKTILTELDKITNIENLYKTVQTLSLLQQTINIQTVKSLLDDFLKKDSSALNQAFAYRIATLIFTNKIDLKKYFIEIEDTIQQADEADNIHMFYDDGVFSTAFIVNSIFDLSQHYQEAPPVSIDKWTKFSNFLLSRRYTYQLKAAVELTKAIKNLSQNKYAVPIVASLVDNVIGSSNDAKLRIRVTNLWGEVVNDAQVVSETVKQGQTSVNAYTNKALSPLGDTYALDFGRLNKGFYSVKLNVNVNETRYAPIFPTLVAKVVSDVTIDNAELSIRDRDQVTGVLNYKLAMGSLLSDKLTMNWHHRLDMRFALKDADSKSFRAHQVFVRLTHVVTKQEIIFVVEPDKTDVYKFSLDLDKSNKDFDNVSGDYQIELVIGDAVVRTPPSWHFANIKLDMPSSPSTDNTGESRRTVAGSKRSVVNPRIGTGPTVAKPQIFHMFKPAEKRGGQFISTVFTVLCIVPPFLIMLVLWGLLGMNVSNFQLSLSPLMFHAGILAIFGLYYCYWSYLNMFTTLKYMVPLGAFTAFFGNRVLRSIAAKRKEA